jgi:nucleotide-binding universal stress UspA family protein
MFKTIVVATDGAEQANKAVGLASDLALKYDARMVLVHVLQYGPIPEGLRRMLEAERLVEPTTSGKTKPVAGVPRWLTAVTTGKENSEELRLAAAAAEQIVSQAERVVRTKGVKNVHTTVEDGDAARRILECAERENADLIIVGSRGFSDLKGLLMGSVSHKVSELAKCTCITVK